MLCCLCITRSTSSSISLLFPMRIQLFSWLYFLTLCSILFGIHVSFVSGECRICLEDQMSLLLKLKNNLKLNVAAAANNLVSWDPNTNSCTWRGVACDANGHVVSLDLSSHSVSGEFNSIFNLQHLQSLNLANNDFDTSQIPSGFQKLRNLTYLNLSNAGFSGQIPMAMANLTQLVYLDFSGNEFSGPIPSFSLSKNLIQINFSHNNLSGQIPSSIGQLPRLQSLDLSMNNLSGEIPAELATLNFLSVLNLSFNQLEGSIPEGSRFRTFSEDSYIGNRGLCGFPLNAICEEDATEPASEESRWEYIAVEIGFVTGLGIVYWPLLLNRGWRKRYYQHVDRILSRVLN